MWEGQVVLGRIRGSLKSVSKFPSLEYVLPYDFINDGTSRIMFEKLLKTLQELDQSAVQVSAKNWADEDGYLDRECPAPDCLCSFKVLEEDWWSDKVRDEEVFCPFCRHSADAQKWFTQDQVEHMNQQALAQVSDMMDEAMRADAQAWNRRQPAKSFVKISMKVSHKPSEIVVPLAAAEPMRLKIECNECHCRFAVIGSAFFCPGCGHNAADRVFTQSVETIRATLAAVPIVRASIANLDAAENTARVLIETGLQNAVMAFQRFAEALYATQSQTPKARRNVFQNLLEGSALWEASFGHAYTAHLREDELSQLTRFFQQRHLLAHREGVVDDDYIVKSGDTRYRTGQRIVIREEAVMLCAELIEKLSTGMKTDVRCAT